ncbi:MAG: OmpA family protein [Ferruginibacter sp.]
MKKILFFFVFSICINMGYAQLGNLLNRAKRKVENKVDQKIDQKMDNAAQKTVDEADDAISGKKKKQSSGNGNGNGNSNNDDSDSKASGPSPKSFKAYGKYDFVPGEKIIAFEDFQQDAQGDFPSKWNTNSSGEIKIIEGNKSKWLALSKSGTFFPEFINSIPENCTIEFDVASSDKYSYYSGYLSFVIAKTTGTKQIFNSWKGFGAAGREGIALNIHPQGAGAGDIGMFNYRVWEKGEEIQKNEGNQSNFTNVKNIAHVAIWRQKNRIRLYLDESKIIDIPRALNSSAYNSIVFFIDYSYERNDEYLISNLKVAVGAPDTRNKLLTVGKFVTHGILFDTNSDKIKPESYGALKDIANVLNENADVRVKIVGHTDSDGDDKANIELSKKRAAAVKISLSKDFGIDAGRMETDGKGEAEPADKNITTEGKANNRRVEFIKL